MLDIAVAIFGIVVLIVLAVGGFYFQPWRGKPEPPPKQPRADPLGPAPITNRLEELLDTGKALSEGWDEFLAKALLVPYVRGSPVNACVKEPQNADVPPASSSPYVLCFSSSTMVARFEARLAQLLVPPNMQFHLIAKEAWEWRTVRVRELVRVTSQTEAWLLLNPHEDKLEVELTTGGLQKIEETLAD